MHSQGSAACHIYLKNIVLTWRMVLAKVSLAVQRHQGRGNSYEGRHFTGAGLQSFRGLLHYHHCRKHGSVQAGRVLEMKLRVLHLNQKAARRRLEFHTGWSLSIGNLKAHPHSNTFPPTRPCLLQQGHTLWIMHSNT